MALDERKYSRYFKAFSDPTRLQILKILADKELTVNEIADRVGLSQPTISRHLGLLRDADIVIDRREGQRVYYSLNKKVILNCCNGFCDCLAIDVRVESKKRRK